MKIYLAHQISGLSYDEVYKYYQETITSLRQAGYYVFHPMIGKSYFRGEREFKNADYRGFPLSTNHAILQRDMWMVANSDVVYVNFEGTKQASIGMIAELTAAHVQRKNTVITLPKENMHNHAFIHEMADIEFNSHQDTMDYLLKLIEGTI
jgi:hypothetical protein